MHLGAGKGRSFPPSCLLVEQSEAEAMAAVDLSHTRTVEETLELYKVSEDEGLSNERVLEQRHKFGYNGEYINLAVAAASR